MSSYVFCCLFFFFKQKTAYEMRISDWSSDVCSSDLPTARPGRRAAAAPGPARRRRHDRSRLQPVAGGEHAVGHRPEEEIEAGHDHDAQHQRAVGIADEAVAKAVDHIEEGIEVGDHLPGLRQPLDGIEGAGQEGERSEEHTSELQSLMSISYDFL